jgi:RNA polymerase sigma-70 factor (ECF subfamily)
MPENSIRNSGSLKLKLRQAMAQLPEFQREAFMMMKVEGLSLMEASERTGTSVSALKVRMHRAYTSLKKSMLG